MTVSDSPTCAVLRRRGLFVGRVVENVLICQEHYRLRVEVAGFPGSSPGQFLQVLCRDPNQSDPGEAVQWTEHEYPRLDGIAGGWGMLRRPFSIAGRVDLPGGRSVVDLIHRVVGPGTAYLAGLRVGDELSLLGPLGQPFPTLAEDEVILLVGGGVGIPPFVYAAEQFGARLAGKPRVVAFCGSTTLDLLALTRTKDAPPPATPTSIDPLYNIAEFARHGIPAVISTDDGSYGYKGYVTQALAAYLDRYFAGTWGVGSRRPTVFTCGSEAMMKATAEVARARGLRCYASVERSMACGMGTCQSCCIRVKSPSSVDGWRYALSCTEGPVFDCGELLW
jgi:dihydroorotate dehydrogenase electron transfer subunit